jgi:hypothetical protein
MADRLACLPERHAHQLVYRSHRPHRLDVPVLLRLVHFHGQRLGSSRRRGDLMFRVGSKNGHSVYWSDTAEGSTEPDRYVCAALTIQAAVQISMALANFAVDCGFEDSMPPWVESLPMVPRREAT